MWRKRNRPDYYVISYELTTVVGGGLMIHSSSLHTPIQTHAETTCALLTTALLFYFITLFKNVLLHKLIPHRFLCVFHLLNLCVLNTIQPSCL